MECESKMENPGSPDREGGADVGPDGMADCDGVKGGAEETEDSKKRKRKPYRPGKLSRICQKTSNIYKCLEYPQYMNKSLSVFCNRNWRLHGATKEVSHTDEERVFRPACWRDYIRWTANRENH